MADVRLGKWQKGEMQRIYFNSPLLGNGSFDDPKVFAYARPDGTFDIKEKFIYYSSTMQQFVDMVEREAEKMIADLLGKPIGFDTKFADVWSAVN